MDDHPHRTATRMMLIRQWLLDHVVLVLAAFVVATTGGAFWYLSHLQDALVSAMAEQGTRLQAESLQELRALYTTDIVAKVSRHGIEVSHDYEGKDNAIPLPANLTIELGRRIKARGSGMDVRLYSDYPFPWRKNNGPRDAFEREALSALRADPSKAFFRFEEFQGQTTLRYAIADRMLAACVGCHNTHPASPKVDWKVGDVRGVLEIFRPITGFAAAARTSQHMGFALIATVALLGLLGVGLLSRQRRASAELTREIEERKQVEAKLVANTARLSAMNEASPLGTLVTDVQGRCLHVNPTYQAITGYSEEMIGADWSTGVHPEDQERVWAAWRNAFENDRTLAIECRHLRRDGSNSWVSLKAAAMRSSGSNDQLLGYVITVEDISERKKVERMKNEFISTVSHELRTPLTSIMGSLGLIAGGVSGTLSVQTKTLVEIARKNSERLVRLINDILDIEKIESGSMHFDLLPQTLQPLLEQAVAANRAYAQQFGVSYRIATELYEVRARVDADRFMQVMTNLMANAAKFSPRDADIDLSLERRGYILRIAVSDRGPGIPDSFRDKIFGKFSQADSSDTRQKGGTGLGLSISKAIVEAMGGKIGFEAREGGGTTFFVELAEWVDPVQPAPYAFFKAASLRACVLVCEDDPDVSTLLCMMLDQAGYDSVPARDAATARQLLAEREFVAMTLDINLPDLDGRTFLRQLRADPDYSELPIVVVSANLRKTVRKHSGDGLGVIDWLAKPIDQERLLSALRRGTRGTKDGKSTVLYVEDDPDIRLVVASLCAEFAEFEFAESFQQAAERLAVKRYDLVILDITLPDRSGWDLLPLIEQLSPPPPVLVFSGKELPTEDVSRVAATLVKSHVSNPELLETIRKLAGQSPQPHVQPG